MWQLEENFKEFIKLLDNKQINNFADILSDEMQFRLMIKEIK